MSSRLRRSLLPVMLLLGLSACTDNSTATKPSETSDAPTTVAVETTEAQSTTTRASVVTTAPSTSEPAADCPVVTFENLPAPWDPTIKDLQGDGSSLPGAHIERPGAFINLFPGGSIWEPSSPENLTVDGHPAQLGTVEDGLSVRVTLPGPCDKFDFVAYGVADAELRSVMTAVRFG